MFLLDVRAEETTARRAGTRTLSRRRTEVTVPTPVDGETVLFEEKEVYLSETVHVLASNVSIIGRPGGTRVHCPENGGAFVVRLVGKHDVNAHLSSEV